MTSRRRHHDDRTPDRRDDASEHDPWRLLGAADEPVAQRSGDEQRSSLTDDFWGDVPDWSSSASTTRRSGRRRIGSDADEPFDPTPIGTRRPTGESPRIVGTIRSAWDGLLGGAPDVTREHRRVDLSAHLDEPGDPYGLFDDVDELDDVDRVVQPEAGDDASHREPSRRARHEGRRTAAGGAGSATELERTWVAEAAASRPPRAAARPIDPLLVRLGAVVIVACLLVPMLVAVLGSDDALEDTLGSIAATEPAVAATVVPAPPAVADTPASTVLDPASLPPAVPVDTAAGSAPGAADAGASDATDDTSGGDASTVEVASAESTDASAGDGEASRSRSAELQDPAEADEPATRVEPPSCPVAYTVVSGDFWLRLADAADVELADLLAVNGATVDTPLYPGSEICLPEGATTPAPPATTPATTATTAAPTTAATTSTTTTSTTTTTVATTAPPRAEPPGPEEIKQIVRDVWPDDLEDRALEIVYRESRFVPTAKNFCCYGLFQIYWSVHRSWLDDLGITSADQLYDPETNARAALALYERAGGWGPWGF